MCKALNCDLISWKSDEYIGREGKALQLSNDDNIGTEVRNGDNSTTVATLVDKYNQHGLPVLVCQLNITVSPNILKSSQSVTCLNADLNTETHYQFESGGGRYLRILSLYNLYHNIIIISTGNIHNTNFISYHSRDGNAKVYTQQELYRDANYQYHNNYTYYPW